MKTKQVLNVMKIISWVIFIGLCIKVGAIIISFFVSLFVNEAAASNLYKGLDLASLYEFNSWYYISILSLVVFLIGVKAYMFYLVIKILSKFNLETPFSSKVSNLISKISYTALGTGIVAVIANYYKMWLVKQGFEIPLHFGSAEFLLMSGILFIVAFIFKHGVEIQSENELTI